MLFDDYIGFLVDEVIVVLEETGEGGDTEKLGVLDVHFDDVVAAVEEGEDLDVLDFGGGDAGESFGVSQELEVDLEEVQAVLTQEVIIKLFQLDLFGVLDVFSFESFGNH